MTKLRRNDIVGEIDEGQGGFCPYGRVWRRLDDTHVEVVYGSGWPQVYADDELKEHNEYQGRWLAMGRLREAYPIFDRMPTLRVLKAVCARRSPELWQARQRSLDINDDF